MDLLTYMQNLGFSPSKVSTANGGEYSSACPGCGDGGKGSKSDRFHIWPYMEGKGLCNGRFWCRQCDANGDTIEFLQKYCGMDFLGACVDLGINLPHRGAERQKNHVKMATIKQQKSTWLPRDYGKPSPVWQEKAANLLADCTARLANAPDAMAWLEARGISKEFATKYRIGFNQSSKDKDRYRPRSVWGLDPKHGRGGKKVTSLWIPRGWVIPSFDVDGSLLQLRVRRMDEDIAAFCDNIKYLPLDGSSSATLIVCPDADVFIPIECGFDAYLIAGAMHGKVGTICTWNDSARPDVRAHRILSRSSLILNGLDFDAAGEKQQEWWNKTYKNNRRLASPGDGIKDPGEAYEAGINIQQWIADALPRGLRISLGFDGPKKSKKPEKAKNNAKNSEKNQQPQQEEESGSKIIEVELISGVVIYITDDREQWNTLTSEGKAVFSSNELERLKTATSSMSKDERVAAVAQAVEVKKEFGGYIRRGAVVEPVDI